MIWWVLNLGSDLIKGQTTGTLTVFFSIFLTYLIEWRAGFHIPGFEDWRCFVVETTANVICVINSCINLTFAILIGYCNVNVQDLSFAHDAFESLTHIDCFTSIFFCELIVFFFSFPFTICKVWGFAWVWIFIPGKGWRCRCSNQSSGWDWMEWSNYPCGEIKILRALKLYVLVYDLEPSYQVIICWTLVQQFRFVSLQIV